MKVVYALSQTVDLIHSPNEGGSYLRESKNDGKGTIRTSTIFKTSRDAWTAFRDNTVQYGKWGKDKEKHAK